MSKKDEELTMPEPLILDGGNIIVTARPDGSVIFQTTGSMEALFNQDALGELVEWLDDVVLAQALADAPPADG